MTEKQQSLKHWQLERDSDDILWLTLDRSDASTNALSHEVLEELESCLQDLGPLPRGVVIRSGKENGFIAGADIKEFVSLTDPSLANELIRRGQAVMDRIEALDCPTVAMINGFCLGGGLELALACRYRIADDDPRTRLGLPEVKLGIHPGFGGSVRLTRLIGPIDAMPLMLAGRSVDARRAKKLGIIDYAVPKRHLLRAARSMVLDAPPPHKLKGWKSYANHNLVRPLLGRYMRRNLAKQAREDHYPAPFALIDLWQHYGDDPQTMLREEARSVTRLITGHTAQNLVRVFFLQERLKSEGDKKAISPTRVHVIGGGVMGGDIAAWCALQGMRVTIQDHKHEHLAQVLKRAHALYKKRFKHPRLIQGVMDRLVPDMDGLGLPHADVVIEAIFENLEAKHSLFKEIEPKMRPDALLATNTSSIPLEELGQVLKTPERLVGLHFFNPVARMQLVEIVKADNTDATVVKQAAAFARHIDRLPLPVKSSPGFLVNRILMPYLLEAVVLAEEGVPLAAIDKAALDFGMPMGPIELADTVGLDICLSVANNLSQHLGGEVPSRLRELVDAGFLGRKSGRGFYSYKQGKPQKPSIEGGNGAAERKDITDRLMLRLCNEAVACLREGVVSEQELLDAGVIFGTGFAPFRGGPLHYMYSDGLTDVRARLEALAQRHGERFQPDEGWSSLQ